MRNLSKLILFLLAVVFIHTAYYILPTTAHGQVPGLHFPCDDTDDNEFNSLRPYQASPCGPYPKQALFCSNKLVIFETFDLAYKCQSYREYETGTRNCEPNHHVDAHNLNITLDESELPIMGNTQDDFDDAQKVNEYASWYLSGVNDKRENENATDDQIVNFSGPVKKLLPSMVQDAQRIEIIRSTKRVSGKEPAPSNPLEQDESPVSLTDNHDQLVVGNLRLSDWDGSLSFVRTATNIVGGIVSYLLSAQGIEYPLEGWNHAFPPLPWDDGTVEFVDEEHPAVPFKDNLSYKKAYNEWLGKSCLDLGVFGLQCLDNPLITNKYAELWHFVPLSNNSDSEGKNYLLTGDGPSYVPSQGTEIDGAQHKSFKNALLYFSHMQEVMGLSGLLNKTYTPEGHESEKLPETTEKIKKGIKPVAELPTTLSPDKQYPVNLDPYANLDCSAVNVRVNEGDDLFPGDRPSGKELFVEGAEYDITNVECDEVYEKRPITCTPEDVPDRKGNCYEIEDSFKCIAQVGIEFKTGTKTPLVDEIFSQTVADSGSTFRKIFPKVEEGAPVECIADIPTTTNVTYKLDPNLTEPPTGGTQEFKETIYPADGANSNTQLTFPHIGSVYEYFLKGIQTALRPKGFGEPLVNGNCKPVEPIECGIWEEKLEKSSGGDCGVCTSGLGDLAKRILATAGKQYNVPAASIWAAMKHEGGDWDEFRGQFTDENVRKWSTPEQCGGEPMPSCDSGDKSSSKAYPPFGHLPYWFYKGNENDGPWAAVQQFDPTRNSPETVSHCNFLDAAFASAKNLATWSGYVRTPPFCYGFNLGMSDKPASCGDWEDYNIVQSHVGYWIGTTPWCPDGTGGPIPSDLGSNIAIPDYASRVLSDFKSAKCN